MDILVTGGAGFIGSCLVEKLLSFGHKVRVLDNLSSGCVANLDVARSKNKDKERLVLMKGDIRDSQKCLEATYGVDLVYHFAARTTVSGSKSSATEIADINIQGFKSLSQACLSNNISKLIYASSSAVYGQNAGNSCKENEACRPCSAYGASKLQNESDAQEISGHSTLNCVGLRYFNVYGFRQRLSESLTPVIPAWVSAFTENKTIPVYGDLNNSRDFIWVEDAVDASILASKLGAKSSIYNIASGNSISLTELYRLMKKIALEMGLEQLGELEMLPFRMGDINKSVADVSKAVQELGFTAKKSLQCGLRELMRKKLDDKKLNSFPH